MEGMPWPSLMAQRQEAAGLAERFQISEWSYITTGGRSRRSQIAATESGPPGTLIVNFSRHSRRIFRCARESAA